MCHVLLASAGRDVRTFMTLRKDFSTARYARVAAGSRGIRPMYRPRYVAFHAVIASLAFVTVGRTQSAKPLPAIPEPPAQRKPWTPPRTTLPQAYISATRALFEMGLADPRGCQYRAIEVKTGNQEVLPTHGWILPDTPPHGQRFAVCWNGLVYPVLSVGGDADLEKDIRPAAQPQEDGPAHAGSSFTFEELGVAPDSDMPLKICLLLRLGKAELAHTIVKRMNIEPGTGANSLWELPDDKNPETAFLRLLLRSMYDRAIYAHARGEDGLAVASARELARVRDRLGAELRKEFETWYREFPDLLTDQERRARSARRPAELAVDQGKRIKALIEDLQEDGLQGFSAVRALIKEGSAAVEPLLACLTDDDRLNRTIIPDWRISAPCSLSHVYNDAMIALRGILNLPLDVLYPSWLSPGHTREGRRQLADKIREYWTKYRSMSLHERWYAILRDDRADERLWLEAAGQIVHRSSDSGIVGKNGVGALQGEDLRGKTEPSVSELLRTRAGTAKVGTAYQFTTALAAWDGKRSLPELARFAGVLRESWDSEKGRERHELISMITGLCVTRARLGDTTALDDYASWVVGVGPTDCRSARELFEPLWDYYHHPALVNAARWIFGNARSPWHALLRDPLEYQAQELIKSPVLAVPALRNRALEGLRDNGRNPAGQVREHWAALLAELPGMPDFDQNWPEEKRQEAVAACERTLVKYGERIVVESAEGGPNRHRDKARIAFPKLDRPATIDDVRAAQAIFSLQGEGPTRKCKLPVVPLKAQWAKAPGIPPKSEPGGGVYQWTSDLAARECEVWQVEEVFKGGKWERYYGIVARHEITKVPGTDISFRQLTFTHVSGLVEPWAEVSGGVNDQWMVTVKAGQPVPLTLRLQNCGGLDTTLPTPLCQGSKLYPGLVFNLSMIPLGQQDTPPSLGRALHMTGWKELPTRSAGHFRPQGKTRELATTEEVLALAVDLRDWFDITRPGLYRLSVGFSAKDGCFMDGESFPAFWVVVPSDSGRK
jgi:hypothetical protein